MSNHTEKKPAYFPVSPNLAVPVRNGFLVATPASDPLYPGIDVEFIPDEQHINEYKEVLSKPRVLIEEPQDDTRLRALLWTDLRKKITPKKSHLPNTKHHTVRITKNVVQTVLYSSKQTENGIATNWINHAKKSYIVQKESSHQHQCIVN